MAKQLQTPKFDKDPIGVPSINSVLRKFTKTPGSRSENFKPRKVTVVLPGTLFGKLEHKLCIRPTSGRMKGSRVKGCKVKGSRFI